MKKTNLICLLIVLLLILSTACEKNETSDVKIIKVGVVGEANEMWEAVNENLKDKGLQVELVKFSDYNLPNEALSNGEIDLNGFQHRKFLAAEIQATGYELSEIGVTLYAPLTLYSNKHKSFETLNSKALVVIPSDPTNSGRSLKLLEKAELIKMDPAVGYMGEVKDILENPFDLQIRQVEAAQTASFLAEADLVVVNGGHAHDNGLSPEKDGLLSENLKEEKDNPFLNVLVAQTSRKDEPELLAVVEAYQQENVAEKMLESFHGALVPAW